MRRAIELAWRGRYTTSPNPRVGCVITQTNPPSPPQIIGEGYHLRKGLPHAEREALEACSESPEGAALYVNLEPCCHTGATPPCTEAILEAGIARVVIAARDPFESVKGKSVELLRQQNIQVDVGLLEEEARYLNRFFFHRHEAGLPWVILKCAMSLDGKLCTAAGESKWITGEEAREHVHEHRAEADAVMAGIGTVLKDDPSLTARPAALKIDEFMAPNRVIMDSNLRIPFDAKVFSLLHESNLWIFCGDSVDNEKRRKLEDMGANVYPIQHGRNGLNLLAILQTLAEKNCLSVFIEGGPKIHTSFLTQNLVNEIMIYAAPVLIGGDQAPTFFEGEGINKLSNAFRLQKVERVELGVDTLIRGILNWRLE